MSREILEITDGGLLKANREQVDSNTPVEIRFDDAETMIAVGGGVVTHGEYGLYGADNDLKVVEFDNGKVTLDQIRASGGKLTMTGLESLIITNW